MSNNVNLSVNDFGKICRTCLAEGEIRNGEMKLIFEKSREEVCLVEMLMSINFVKFSEKDGLPVQICLNCVSEVTRAYKFAQKCSDVDEKLRKCLQEFTDNRSKSVLFPTDAFDITNKQTQDPEDEIQIKTENEIESDEHEIELIPEIVLIKNEFLSDQEECDNKETNENMSEEISDNNIVNEGGNESDFHPENDSESSVYESEEELKLERRIANKVKSKEPNLNRINCKIRRTHSGEKPYKCEPCEKEFSTLQQLNGHMRVHSESPYVCNFCGKEFEGRRYLIRHKRIHTGEKPYKCNICEKSFAVTSSLKLHMRTHTGEKPYKCNICARPFAQTSSLKMHMRIHTGERPAVCKHCGKSFTSNGNLNCHLKIHVRDDEKVEIE